jgi:hypothetical protein
VFLLATAVLLLLVFLSTQPFPIMQVAFGMTAKAKTRMQQKRSYRPILEGFGYP